MAGVSKPFIAKVRLHNQTSCHKGTGANEQMADLWSRPGALSFSVFFFTIGVIMIAAAQNITTVCVGLVVYTLGNSGISFRMSPSLLCCFAITDDQ
jgi:hypothetical protein